MNSISPWAGKYNGGGFTLSSVFSPASGLESDVYTERGFRSSRLASSLAIRVCSASSVDRMMR